MKRFAGLFLSLLLFSPLTAFAAGPTTIAVAAEGKVSTSQVSGVAARCPYFLLFDEKGTFVEAVANPNKDARGGAGTESVDLLAGKGVKAVIAGAFGQNMVDAMKGRGMRYLEFKGIAADAVKKALVK
jgi:predicted Fe-Mo cluster-binding NifX family protein